MIRPSARLLLDGLADVAGTLALACVVANLSTATRPPLVLAGLVFSSGWAVTAALPLPVDTAFAVALALAFGVAVPTAVSIVLVEGGWWRPITAVTVLLVAASTTNVFHTARHLRQMGRR
ncbi:MAG: hypothetical protein ACYCUG_15340 [Acidimicrobiales bacterium]